MPDGISYSELAELIEKLSSEGTSGTLFLRTEDNHSGMIMFQSGSIVGVTCGVARGQKAIQELRSKEYFTYRFQQGPPPPMNQDLKSPEETLIAFGVLEETSPAAEESVRLAAASRGDNPASGGLGGVTVEMDHLMRAILFEELVEHLGPAASVMISEAEAAAGGLVSREQIARTLETLCEDVESNERETFLRGIQERTSSLFTKTACSLVTNELNEYVGPAAASICDEHIQQMGGGISSPEELQQLVNALAGEISDPGEAKRFVERVQAGLRKISSNPANKK